MPLSVVINTKNAQATLDKCLKSVQFADQVVVVDMHSSDKTQQIAEFYQVDWFLYQDIGFVEPARNFAVSKAKYDWVLVVDADEEVPKSLQTVIKKIITNQYFDQKVVAVKVPRANIVFGKRLEHTGWWPDYQLRLFKKDQVTWSDTIHQQPKVTGMIKELPVQTSFALIHHNYQTISQFLDRLNRYTTIQASQQPSLKQPNIPQAFSDEFIARFFFHQGDKDGLHGLVLSWLQAQYQVMVELKRWEAAGFLESPADTTQLEKLNQSLKFWLLQHKAAHSRYFWQRWYWKLLKKLSNR